MQLMVITPDREVKDEATIVNSLFAHGLRRLHVRKPLFTIEDYRNYIKGIDPKYRSYIVLHGGYLLTDEFELGGIHLNSMARGDKAIWQQVAKISPSFLSTSFHSWQEIRDNEFEYGYVFISPVFDSISKKGYHAGIDLAGSIETKHVLVQRNKYCPQIIGLGGVGVSQIKPLYDHSFDGAAVLGAIWQSENPVNAFKEIMSVTTSL